MSEADRARWDAGHRGSGPVPAAAVEPPPVFAGYAADFPTAGDALDLACGNGRHSVWLALRGLTVRGWDVSPVAVAHARDLAERCRVASRCRFGVADLDAGLPAGGPVDVILCHRFRAPDLYPAIAERLAPGGLLAIAVLSEAGSAPGRFRAAPGELAAAFSGLESVAGGEGGGIAWLLARRRAVNAVESPSVHGMRR